LKRENPEKIRALKQIQDVILIKKESPILKSEKRIEGYDISHFSGKESVGAMVVFLGNEPQKSEYRLFKIKSAPKNDDLRALKEVILRRFNHPEWQFPDLILIDGGKPQVDFIFKVLKEKKIKIPIIGISKYKKDELIFPYKTSPSFKKLAQSLKNLLLQVREEAHRFSNSFRKRISKLKN
jgi:excinuclease ABC subunit C